MTGELALELKSLYSSNQCLILYHHPKIFYGTVMGHTYLSLMNVLKQKLFSNFTIITTARWVKRDAFLMENPYFFYYRIIHPNGGSFKVLSAEKKNLKYSPRVNPTAGDLSVS